MIVGAETRRGWLRPEREPGDILVDAEGGWGDAFNSVACKKEPIYIVEEDAGLITGDEVVDAPVDCLPFCAVRCASALFEQAIGSGVAVGQEVPVPGARLR